MPSIISLKVVGNYVLIVLLIKPIAHDIVNIDAIFTVDGTNEEN